jgi:quercetin dioxygenase-like cupin family protein
MPRRAILVIAGVLISCAILLAQGAAAEKGNAAPKPAGKKAVFMPAGDMKWEATPGAPPDVKGVTLWGDPTKGPYGGIQKFPPGFSAPLHTHSSDLHAVVISGTFLVAPEGGTDNKLPAGSYEFIPSTFKHTTKCDTGAECIVFIETKGKFDVKPVGEAKKAAEKPAKKM